MPNKTEKCVKGTISHNKYSLVINDNQPVTILCSSLFYKVCQKTPSLGGGEDVTPAFLRDYGGCGRPYP